MANRYPLDRDYLVLPANDDGNILVLGNSSGTDAVGGWLVHLVPDGSSDIEIAILGRITGKVPSDESVAFIPIPYRRINLAGVVSDYAMVTTGVTVSGNSIIQIPANGLSVGLLVSTKTGTAKLYSMPVVGSTAV